MKTLLISVGLTIFSTQALATTPHLQPIVNCELSGPLHAIKLLRSNPLADSYIYSIRHIAKIDFMYGNSNESRGSDVQWRCVSDNESGNILIVSGEFTSNFLQGVMFYFDSTDKKIERIDFAERNRPRWIINSKQGAQVIFENTGNESSSKYLSYQKNGVYEELSELPTELEADGIHLIDLNNFKKRPVVLFKHNLTNNRDKKGETLATCSQVKWDQGSSVKTYTSCRR